MGMTGFVDQFPHILRDIADEAQPVSRDRVGETEHCGMKGLTCESQPLEKLAKLRIESSINRVSQ